MVIYLPALICITGLLIYALATDGKVSSIGKDMFWCGLLVTLFMAERLVHLP